MKQATGALCALALCGVLESVTAAKVRNAENKDAPDSAVALASEKKKTLASACLTHRCSNGYHLKVNFDNITGDASDNNCCNPTCRFWNCSTGWKSDASYENNVGDSDQECCDKTCSIFDECQEGTGVPDSKKDAAGIDKDACCEPKCVKHSCLGEWAQDLSKKDVVASSDKECCLQSCAAVKCDASKGLVPHPDRQDKAGTTTEYCCQKVCKYYESKCPADTGLIADEQMRVVPDTKTEDEATKQCCSAKCSGHTCADGYTLKPARLNDFVSKVLNGCCEKTCAAHTCSTGWVKVASKENNTQPTDAACCEKTCALYVCPSGWFNSTDETKLASANRSTENCCEPSCKDYTCGEGMSLRPDPSTIPKAGTPEAACCESTICVDLRTNYTATSAAQVGSSTEGADCNDFSGPEDNCTKKYKMFNVSGAITAVPCIVDPVLSICKMDDSRVASGCSDL